MLIALGSEQITLAGLGAVLLGAGSFLSGWAALRRAKDEHKEREEEFHRENPKPSSDS
jgi:hypothetical protein